MKKIINFYFLLISILTMAQDKDSIVTATDTIRYTIELEEVILTENGSYTLTEEQKRMAILKRRVYKTYPYAKLASEKIGCYECYVSKTKNRKRKEEIF